MPDELAGRATLLLLGGIVLGTALGFAVSALWPRWRGGASAGRQRGQLRGRTGGTVWADAATASGTLPGIAAGLALFAAAMTWVALDMAAVVASRSAWVTVQGTVLGFDAVKLRETRGGYRLRGNEPVVEFTHTDGSTHLVRGLAGSLQRREPGALVPVRVNPADPKQAVVADFQNQYAALWLFGSFALLAGLGAVFSAVCAVQAGAVAGHSSPTHPPRNRPSKGAAAAAPTAAGFRATPQGQHWQHLFQRAGWVTAALSLLALFLLVEKLHLGRAIATTMAGLTTALACGAVAALLKPGAPLLATLLGRSIGVLAGGLLAAFVWLLSGP